MPPNPSFVWDVPQAARPTTQALGLMKRTLRLAFILSALFIIADETLSSLVTSLHNAYTASLSDNPWQFSTFAWAYLFLSVIVFVAAGAILTCFIPQRRLALLLAFAFGVAVPASRLFFDQPRPWFYQDHGVTWLLLAVSWANWWLPPIGVCLGAIAAYGFRSKLAKTRACGPTNHSTGPCA